MNRVSLTFVGEFFIIKWSLGFYSVKLYVDILKASCANNVHHTWGVPCLIEP
jgi:hypothetical protein